MHTPRLVTGSHGRPRIDAETGGFPRITITASLQDALLHLAAEPGLVSPGHRITSSYFVLAGWGAGLASSDFVGVEAKGGASSCLVGAGLKGGAHGTYLTAPSGGDQG